MADDQQEQPELPPGLADQVDALARDESEAVAAAWQRIARHVPADVVEALPDGVLIGIGPQRGAFRFVDDEGETVEVRDRGDGATVMRRDRVDLYRHGAFASSLRLPRTPPSDDPSAN
jgi:hypothetical protein